MEPGVNQRIYVSSKQTHASLWKLYINRGYNIISSWIHLNGNFTVEEVGNLWPTWLQEAFNSDYLVFYSTRGETNHISNLLEISATLIGGGKVLHVGESDTMKTQNGKWADFTYHPNWFKVSSLDKAFDLTREWNFDLFDV